VAENTLGYSYATEETGDISCDSQVDFELSLLERGMFDSDINDQPVIQLNKADPRSALKTSHPPRFYAALNFLKMGIKMPRFVVFWMTSTIKDEKSAAKFHYIKTVSGRVVAQSIAFRVVSTYWQG